MRYLYAASGALFSAFAYLAGLILGPVIGWTGGTLAGGALTRLLPQSVSNALGIALYGMFIAVVVPAARKNRAILFTAVFAAVLSAVCYYTPALLPIRRMEYYCDYDPCKRGGSAAVSGCRRGG